MNSTRTVLVSVQGPDRRIDVDLPLDRSVGDLVPELLRALGPPNPDAVDPAQWELGPAGGRPLPAAFLLADCGVRDGTVLQLRDVTGAPPAVAADPPPPDPASPAVGPASPAVDPDLPVVNAVPPSVEPVPPPPPAAAPPAPAVPAPPAAAAAPPQIQDDGLTPRRRVRAVLPLQPSRAERVAGVLQAIVAKPRTGSGARGAHLPPGTPLSPTKLTAQHSPSMLDRIRQSWRSSDYLARLETSIAAPQLGRCVTIAVVSPKGGVGKTTVTALLGTLFAMVRRDRIVAIDTNPDFGSLGRILAPDHGVFVDDLLAILDRPTLTVTELDAKLGRTAHGLMVLPAPTDPGRMARIDEAAYTRVVRRLQDMVGVVLLDCGTGLRDPSSRAALNTADQVVLISDEVPSTASLVAEAASLLNAEGAPIWLVINKSRGSNQINLDAFETYVPQARGLVLVPDEPQAADSLPAQTFDWRDAPRGWRRSVRELATALVADWSRLGAVR